VLEITMILALLCPGTPEMPPCVIHGNVVQIPDWVPPNIHPDDIPPIEYQGWIIKVVPMPVSL